MTVSRGFTLFELLVVLLLLSLSVVLVAPGLFNSLAGVEDKMLASEVSADLGDLGMRAFLREETLVVSLAGDLLEVRSREEGELVFDRRYVGVSFPEQVLLIRPSGYATPSVARFQIAGSSFEAHLGL